jgi:hypothetical protein
MTNKSFHMNKLRVFHWLLMAALAASLPISAHAAGGRGMGPIGGGPHFSGGRGFAFHDGRFHNRFFARGRFFRGNRFFVRNRFFPHGRFVSGFGFVGFGFPYPYPYPYPYYWYPGPYWGY